ncbi:hypothetical protein ACFV1W_40405 [Kitasatospora sp. NPDC059648]|uniref:hypothetical protein n=1 Tax=Kitasatospora sp. NPDC059648 TaxID=3346894 RepID=UPI0036CE0DA1
MPVPAIPTPIEEQAHYWIFEPVTDGLWGLTLDAFRQALLRREPTEFTHVWDHPGHGRRNGVTMSFGITLDQRAVEGVAGVAGEGAAIRNTTAAQAAEFGSWLAREVVPVGAALRISSREGIDFDVPDVLATACTEAELRELLLDHIRRIDESAWRVINRRSVPDPRLRYW